ncbi:MAG: DUF881 domain-containing protein [Bifidobacteriaceae bacterium]|jgi:uncharacterized protein YlxW (UPF0749 family)|nr:DUF881 domain-containing protein [Bifidobacteriaceae bacterium]
MKLSKIPRALKSTVTRKMPQTRRKTETTDIEGKPHETDEAEPLIVNNENYDEPLSEQEFVTENQAETLKVDTFESQMKTPKRASAFDKLAILLICVIIGVLFMAQLNLMNESPYRNMRDDELIRVLDEQNVKYDALIAQRDTLARQLDELRGTADENTIKVIEKEIQDQEILLGIQPAVGEGISVRLTDSASQLTAENMYNMLTELRNAGAEAIQINAVRVVATSHFELQNGNMLLDSNVIQSPYTLFAIGPKDALEKGLRIAGGFYDTAKANAVEVEIEQKDEVKVSAVAELKEFQNARVQE